MITHTWHGIRTVKGLLDKGFENPVRDCLERLDRIIPGVDRVQRFRDWKRTGESNYLHYDDIFLMRELLDASDFEAYLDSLERLLDEI